ncbi:tyrosine-type recombinase/integrase [Fodinibius salsisoli]|uniref:Tyrosine-type recombinase/integrase n=1 Tax=Fodinibius salsisoli TaxID=2820877 RepID=A0ABT3PPA7_9BACT|nr:tyrosine-type recombinase/integrase [Fodinibius salsisoli]MCW9707676.1 tyrosine-type recombinase/integrase [Fodinibius salsisoli]
MRLKLTNEFIESHPSPTDKKSITIKDSEITNLGIRIFESGTKSWIYRYSINGYAKRYTIGRFPTIGIKEARQEAHNLKKDVAKGIDLNVRKQRNKRKNAGTKLIDVIPKFKNIHFGHLRKATKDSYRQILDNHLKPFHKRRIDDITSEDITNFLDSYANKGKNYMANNIRRVSHILFNYAKDRGYVTENIISDTSPYKVKSKDDDNDDRYLSFKELYKVWKASNDLKNPLSLYYKILILLGSRTTETMHLKWDDLSSDDMQITIPAESTKNGKPHVLPMSERIKNMFVEQHQFTGNSNYIFESSRGNNKPFSSTHYYQSKLKNITGIDDFNNHLIRHSMASHMADIEVDPFSISYVLNHKIKQDVTEKWYVKSQYIPSKKRALNAYHDELFKQFSKFRKQELKDENPLTDIDDKLGGISINKATKFTDKKESVNLSQQQKKTDDESLPF